MDFALGIIPLVTSAVKSCYKLIGNIYLKRENLKTAQTLGEEFRRIEVTLKLAKVPQPLTVERGILKDLKVDLSSISDNVSAAVQRSNKLRRPSTVLEAQDIEQKLTISLHRLHTWKARLEAVKISVSNNIKIESFFEQSRRLQNKHSQLMKKFNVDQVMSDAVKSLNEIAKTLLPDKNDPLGPKDHPEADKTLEETEIINYHAIEQVPEKILKLVYSVSCSRLSCDELCAFFNDILETWNGWHITLKELKMEKVQGILPVTLGEGGFGVVFAGTLNVQSETKTQQEVPVAMKRVKLSDKSNLRMAEVIREVLLQMSLTHFCILKCYGVNLPAWAGTTEEMKKANLEILSAPPEAWIITDRMECNLEEALEYNRISSVEDKIKVMNDVASALIFLHSNKIVHRDVKPQNILVDFSDEGLNGFAKLSDFGCSRRMHIEHSTQQLTMTTKVTGTMLFMPPEVMCDFKNCRSNSVWDVWSFGVLLCFLFSAENAPDVTPAQAQSRALNRTWASTVRHWADCIPIQYAKRVAHACLRTNPSKRPSIEDAIALSREKEKSPEKLKQVRFDLKEGSADEVTSRPTRHAHEGWQSGIIADEKNSPQSKEESPGSNENKKDDERLKGNVTDPENGINMAGRDVYELAIRYFYGKGVQKDIKRAAKLYTIAHEKGEARASRRLGVLFDRGIAVEKNEFKAVMLFKAAAEMGDMIGTYNLGLCYKHGAGTEKNMDRAAIHFKEAADMGYEKASYELGLCYAYGEGVPRDKERAAALFQIAVDKGYKHAFVKLGNCYLSGDGVVRDVDHGASLFKKGAALDESLAIYALAQSYKKGEGVEKDERKAFELFQKAAEKSHIFSIYDLGMCYKRGQGVEKNMERATELVTKAAEKGLKCALRSLGQFFIYGEGVEVDYAHGVKLYQRAAEKGDADAMVELARCYKKGQGIERNDFKAFELFQKAADAKNAGGTFMLGVCYKYGEGVSKNQFKAVELLEKSAKMGYRAAAFNLGCYYTYGQGVDRNEKLGAEYYTQAARKGHASSMYNLALCYSRGVGVEKDDKKAFGWYRRGADKGSASCMCALGRCYEEGQGVEKDEIQAVLCYEKSAAMDNEYAICNLGVCFENGIGVEKNEKRAVELYEQAAGMKNPRAIQKLVACFRHGRGVGVDEERAEELLRLKESTDVE